MLPLGKRSFLRRPPREDADDDAFYPFSFHPYLSVGSAHHQLRGFKLTQVQYEYTTLHSEHEDIRTLLLVVATSHDQRDKRLDREVA